jgi:hypothetical protein
MIALLIGYAVAITIVFFASRTFLYQSTTTHTHTHTSAVNVGVSVGVGVGAEVSQMAQQKGSPTSFALLLNKLRVTTLRSPNIVCPRPNGVNSGS